MVSERTRKKEGLARLEALLVLQRVGTEENLNDCVPAGIRSTRCTTWANLFDVMRNKGQSFMKYLRIAMNAALAGF